jgi:type III restriction enzyme
LGLNPGGITENRLEDYVVSGLIDFDDIAYDENADLLYDLAEQVVERCRSYLPEEEAIHKVLRYHQTQIAKLVHSQMQEHLWEDEVEYEIKVSKGFTELKACTYSASSQDGILNYHQAPQDKSNMAKYLFGGFSKCLYTVQKFQSNTERMLAVILERESSKWFRPAKGQFQLFYQWNSKQLEYQPDFVAETEDCIYMLEPKMQTQMQDPEVLAKKQAAETWCQHASDYSQQHDGKPWHYVLIPHTAIAENMTLKGLIQQYLDLSVKKIS